MKKITSLLLLFVSTVFYAQSSGITYQAIIYNPNGEVTPGYNNANSPLANKSVCLQFSIIDAASQTEYQEKITTTTDEFGMVNLVIGTGIQTGGYATSFSAIFWSVTLKSLKVALDSNGQCSNFLEISNQPFNSVPFAFAANSAENVTGVVPIENGGTNATTVLGAKTNLGLQNVDNTRDLDKPISTATQAALNLKENLSNKSNSVATDATSTVKYPSVKAVKDYVDVSINLGGTALTNEATIRAAADTALTNDLAAEIANRTNADASINNNLALEITNRTNADLLKEDLVNKSNNVNTDGASTTKYPTVKAIKTYVDASDSATSNALAAETASRIAADNTLTANLSAEVNRANATDNTLTSNMLSEFIRATGAENTLTTNLATEVTNRTNADLLKENLSNKSNNVTTDGTSTTKYPTVKSVKDYVDASTTAGTTAVTNEATIRAAADTTLQTNITTLGSTVTANATTAAAATALKENSANKSTDVTLADATNTKFPTELAVKTFVNASAASATTALTNEATIRATADTTLQTNITTLGSTVTANATTAATATALKENSANKSTDVTLADATNTKFPTELAVKTYVNNQITIANATNANLTGAVTSIGNATTVVTNANLTGVVTSTGNATAIANGAITNAMLANGAVANLSGTNTGDQTNITGNAATATTATNVSGIVAIANGGTGATSAAAALTNLGAAPIASPTFTGTVTAGTINAGELTANAAISSEITANFTINNANSELYKGKVLICNPSGEITITFNNDLPLGFNCMILQKSADANKINFLGGTGVTMKNRNNYTATAGNYAIATIVNIGGGIIVTAGDMQ